MAIQATTVKHKILVVDDEPDALELIGFNLKNAGYEVVTAENGTDALKKASELTKGRIGELFVFGLALFGINLVGAILCGVGLLFTYGITAVAVAYAYRTLNGESVAAV